MTANQIAYWNNQETIRANKAREAENFRSNVARETETHRSNVANETETNRANVARETETHRHNMGDERIRTMQAATGGFKDVTTGMKNIAGTVESGANIIRKAVGLAALLG